MKGLLSAEANPTKLFYTLEQIYIFLKHESSAHFNFRITHSEVVVRLPFSLHTVKTSWSRELKQEHQNDLLPEHRKFKSRLG